MALLALDAVVMLQGQQIGSQPCHDHTAHVLDGTLALRIISLALGVTCLIGHGCLYRRDEGLDCWLLDSPQGNLANAPNHEAISQSIEQGTL